MKVKPQEIDRFIDRPDPKVAAILLYGPDQGLVGERARRAMGRIVEDVNDPFRVTELEGEAVRQAPGRLIEEAQALSFGGGRRVVRLRQAGDGVTAALKALLAEAEVAAFVIVEAGELAPRSSLRQLFEATPKLAALPCYRDEAQGVAQLVRAALGEAGLGIEPDALAFLQTHLGGDREVTRRELEKLVLYMEGADPARVRLEDAAAIVGDSSAIGIDELVWAVLQGRIGDAQAVADRLLHEGQPPARLLRGLAGNLHRLVSMRLQVEAGEQAGAVVKKARPPLHFRQQEPARRALEHWSSRRLMALLRRTVAAERGVKSTASPARVLLRQFVTETAMAATAPPADLGRKG